MLTKKYASRGLSSDLVASLSGAMSWSVPISVAVDCLNSAGTVRVGLDAPAKSAYVLRNGRRTEPAVRGAPDVSEQCAAIKNTTWLAREVAEKLKLPRRHRDECV